MAIRVDYVGHASVRIEVDGVRFLTDPVLRPRVAHLRRISPAAHPDVLEGIDVVLISHAHMDHLDVRSLRRMPGSPRVICPGPACRPVARAGLEATSVDAGEAVSERSVRIEVVAADHDGRRWPLLSSGDSVGFVLRGSSGTVYFAGDTGLFDAMSAIESIDLALLPVAGWGPKLGAGHIGPRDAARVAAMIGPRVAVPIHWGTYRRMLMRVREPDDAPARAFVAELAELAPSVRGVVLEPGEGMDLDA